jgi:hypothetical protein
MMDARIQMKKTSLLMIMLVVTSMIPSMVALMSVELN